MIVGWYGDNPADLNDPDRPLRRIDKIQEVPNQWDRAGRAFELHLSCGHMLVSTGEYWVREFNRAGGVPCRQCVEGVKTV